MKCAVMLTLMLIMWNAAIAYDLQVSGGIDLNGLLLSRQDALVVGNVLNVGATSSMQLLHKIGSVKGGLGMDYQFERTHKELPPGWSSSFKKTSFLPVYAVLHYQFPVEKGPTPEFIGHFGYNIVMFDDIESTSSFGTDIYEFDDANYYALGFGLVFNKFVIQSLFRTNNFKVVNTEISDEGIEDYNRKYNASQRQFTLQFGYRFTL